AQTPTRVRVGGNVQAAKLVSTVSPVYPPDCKREGVSGSVLLNAVIGKDGSVASLEPANEFLDARLREAAMSAVKLWRYQTTLLNGNPVEVATAIEVNVTLLP
ncbi:MAG: energy transducer TonB, partial [Acidobacteriota bacterium]